MNAKPAKAKFEKLMDSDDYVIQEKIDGVRALVHINTVGAITVTTRGESVSAPGVPIDITHRLPILGSWIPPRVLHNTVLDTEITIEGLNSAQTAGIISYKSCVDIPQGMKFSVFDLPIVQGNELFEKAQIRRLMMLDKVSDWLPPQIFEVLPFYRNEEKWDVFNSIIFEGKEGIMLKNIHGWYYPGKRPTGVWYKEKKVDSIDAIITGCEPPEKYYKDPKTNKIDEDRYTKPYWKGWFGALTYILEDGSTGTVAGFTDGEKEMLSDGNHGIKTEYIGRFMELKFMERTGEGNLRHARFIRLREKIEK